MDCPVLIDAVITDSCELKNELPTWRKQRPVGKTEAELWIGRGPGSGVLEKKIESLGSELNEHHGGYPEHRGIEIQRGRGPTTPDTFLHIIYHNATLAARLGQILTGIEVKQNLPKLVVIFARQIEAETVAINCRTKINSERVESLPIHNILIDVVVQSNFKRLLRLSRLPI